MLSAIISDHHLHPSHDLTLLSFAIGRLAGSEHILLNHRRYSDGSTIRVELATTIAAKDVSFIRSEDIKRVNVAGVPA